MKKSESKSASVQLGLAQIYETRATQLHSVIDGRCTCRLGAACKSPGKHPRLKDWQTRPFDLERLSDNDNIGLRMGDGLIALDEDKPGEIARLEERYGPLPETTTARTGSGGRHLLFTVTEDLGNSIPWSKKEFKVDVRGRGGQIAVHPSKTPAGAYEWLDTRDPVPLPKDWLRAFKPDLDDPKLLERKPPRCAPEDAEATAIAWAKVAPIAIEGQGGHTALFDLLAELIVGYGLDPDTASDIAAEHYNDRCIPPYEVDSREWTHKVESAAQAERDAEYLLETEIDQATIVDRSAGDGDAWFEDENFLELVGLFRSNELAYARAMGEIRKLIPRRWRELDRLVRKCVREQTKRKPVAPGERAIIAFDSRAWIEDGKGGYHAPVKRSNLLAKLENVERQDLICGDDRSTWRFSVTLASTCFRDFGQRQAARWEDPLTIVTGCPFPDIAPCEDPEVDRWLRAMFGPGYDAFCQWCAVNTPEYADRLSAALIVCGPTSGGKSFLATCLARLWGATDYVPLRAATHRFNAACEETPVWCDDECTELQRGELTSEEFLTLIQRRQHSIERKGVERTKLRGAARIVLTCNDLEQVTFRNAIGHEALKALDGRFSVHDFRERAPEVLDALKALRLPGNDDVDVARVLGHLRWIQTTTKVHPARFAGAYGDAGSLALESVMSRYPAVFDALESALLGGPTEANTWLVREGDSVFVCPANMATSIDAKEDAIRGALRAVTKASDRRFNRPLNGKKTKVWRLGAEFLDRLSESTEP